MKKTVSFACLLACTFIWGTTFIAQDTGMDNIGPFTFNSVRFFVGFLVISPFVFLLERKKIKIALLEAGERYYSEKRQLNYKGEIEASKEIIELVNNK